MHLMLWLVGLANGTVQWTGRRTLPDGFVRASCGLCETGGRGIRVGFQR